MGVQTSPSTRAAFMARLFCSILFPILALACPAAADCQWKSGAGSRVSVAEGEVTRVRPTTVEICSNGAVRIKKKADVGPYKIACGGCVWKGRVICSGEVVKDLYSWWFQQRCSRGRMGPAGRSWLQVSADPRYKPGQTENRRKPRTSKIRHRG